MKWIVQQYLGRSGVPRESEWRDISAEPYGLESSAWESADAGQAFHAAVLLNPQHKISGTSYRVLPYTGGATFDLKLNVDAEAHETEGDDS